MKLLKTLKDGTKVYRVQEKKKDYHGKEYEVDYEVHRKPQTHKSSTRDPCGDLLDTWDDELGDWNP